MQRREVTDEERCDTGTSKSHPSGSKVRVATKKQHTRARKGKLSSTGRTRSPKTLRFFDGDLDRKTYDRLKLKESIALDTETDGLDWKKDKLRIVQICTKEGNCYIVREPNYKSSFLIALLVHPFATKIFHHALFDLRMIKKWLGVDVRGRIECTKTLMKMLRPGSPSGLASSVRDVLKYKMPGRVKYDWSGTLTSRQKDYIVADVLYLHRLVTALKKTAGHFELIRYPTAMKAIRNKVILEIEGFGDVLDYAQADKKEAEEIRGTWRAIRASTRWIDAP